MSKQCMSSRVYAKNRLQNGTGKIAAVRVSLWIKGSIVHGSCGKPLRPLIPRFFFAPTTMALSWALTNGTNPRVVVKRQSIFESFSTFINRCKSDKLADIDGSRFERRLKISALYCNVSITWELSFRHFQAHTSTRTQNNANGDFQATSIIKFQLKKHYWNQREESKIVIFESRGDRCYTHMMRPWERCLLCTIKGFFRGKC